MRWKLFLGATFLVLSATSAMADIAISTITAGGWTQCFSAPYGQNGPSVASAVSGCTGTSMMLAAGVTASPNVLVLAQAATSDVMFDTGFSNTPHNANGTGWYFNDNYSWGFAPQGAPINRTSCDVAAASAFGTGDATSAYRMCWHTGGGQMNGGWRVGDNVGLNSDNGYTKYIFTANNPTYAPVGPQIGPPPPPPIPEPATTAMLGIGFAALAFMARRRRS